MENTSYVGLSYQLALERKMDLIANNIANVDTSGYKSGHLSFEEYLVKARNQDEMSMVVDRGAWKNFDNGPLQQTGNELDIGLQGNGFFGVVTPDGVKYTRNGNLTMNSRGELITSFGMPIADSGGKPISIPAGTKAISFSENGTVSADGVPISQLKIARFENPQALRSVGNSMFETDQPATNDTTTKVYQGMVEGSNVNAVSEMTDMIEVMRRYQSMAQLLQKNHDMELGMIDKLSRI